MKTITRDSVVIKKITRGKVIEDYKVQKDAHLTLVYMVDAISHVTLVPSVHLVGSNARAIVCGVVRATGDAEVHISTLQHHGSVGTTSNLLVKCVLADRSTCKYQGSIQVDKGANKTDAYQRNENLLLDEKSSATSSPVLEILANDVRCTHGAIVKTLDWAELWYLSTRGILQSTARSLIEHGFLSSTLDGIPDTVLREQLAKRIPS